MTSRLTFRILSLLLLALQNGYCKIHHLTVVSDTRLYIEVTNFAFVRGAYFNVEISNFTSGAGVLPKQVGFTFSKGNAMEEILKNNPLMCPLMLPNQNEEEYLDDIVYFLFNFPNKSVDIIRRGDAVEKLEICSPLDTNPELCSSDFANSATVARAKGQKRPSSSSAAEADVSGGSHVDHDKVEKPKMDEKLNESSHENSSSKSQVNPMKKTARSASNEWEPVETGGDSNFDDSARKPIPVVNFLPLTYENKEYYTKFSVRFFRETEEGEYYFYFHNCYNYQVDYNQRAPVTFSISIVERNVLSYLSAGEIVKPKLYFSLAMVFLMTALFWVYLLRSCKENVYKIHYLMATLVFIKALSLFFHGVNFYFISILGRQQEAWAVVYYIMHLLKGALLFGTIILIGTGWTFFKNFLTDRDRRLFMFILPLQVIDNIALIILLESEEGERSYRFWWQLFILVDLICCAAIILPVIWSIRHLQEASQTDGKAAFNLQKLKLFRHFYIIIIVYIYTTRILLYLIKFVVPFQYDWLIVVVEEMGTWFFFVITGYKFRPVSNNPYLRLALSDDESDMDTALTQSGALESVVRVNKPSVPSGRSRRGKREDEEQETGLLAEHSLEHD